MELPFTVVFEAPSRSELRDVLRMRGTWAAGLIVALAIGAAYVLANVAHADAHPSAAASIPALLQVRSRPPGALVSLDDRQAGRTPAELQVAPGAHALRLRPADGLESQYALQVPPGGAALDAVLWRRQPLLTRLRPALPGTSLVDARLLADGDVGLSVAVPPGHQLQGWRLEPIHGALLPALEQVSASRLVFAPDDRFLAYIGPDTGPPSYGADLADRVVWLTPAGAAVPNTGWRPPLEPNERLVDASWSPRAERLLVVSSQPLSAGATLSRLWLVGADGQPGRRVTGLPSQVVPGSEVWSPDGNYVAFVAHADDLSALCLLGADDSFRYVADLDSGNGISTLAYPPLDWSADSARLLFVAPHQHPPGAPSGWLQPALQHALFVADVREPMPLALQDTTADVAAWREDGQLLALSRSAPDAPLGLRLLSASGADSQQLLELPLRPPSGYAAAWDVARARLLVVVPTLAGLEYWLADLALGDPS